MCVVVGGGGGRVVHVWCVDNQAWCMDDHRVGGCRNCVVDTGVQTLRSLSGDMFNASCF